MRKNGEVVVKGLIPSLGAQEQPADDEGATRLPTLTELLWPRFKAGKCVRESGRLSIRVIGGYYVCSVHCPSEGVQTQVILTGLTNLLDEVDVHLRQPTTIWLPDYESQKKARQQAKG